MKTSYESKNGFAKKKKVLCTDVKRRAVTDEKMKRWEN